MFETIFNIANCLPMPFWLAMIVFPKREFTRRMAENYWICVLLGLIYLVFLVWAIATDPAGAGFGFHALRTGLSHEIAFIAAWTHYLCLDLFTGFWIYREGRRLNVHTGVFLFFTLMLGPLGLSAFLIRRAFLPQASVRKEN